jgi:type II secretory pathway pseudopilin PulG
MQVTGKRHVWFLPVMEAAVVGLILLGVFVSAVAWFVAGQSESRGMTREQSTMRNLRTIAQMVAQYNQDAGQLPASLEDLVPRYADHIAVDSWRRPFIYAATPGGPKPFDLRSAGADGVIRNNDDILYAP